MMKKSYIINHHKSGLIYGHMKTFCIQNSNHLSKLNSKLLLIFNMFDFSSWDRYKSEHEPVLHEEKSVFCESL